MGIKSFDSLQNTGGSGSVELLVNDGSDKRLERAAAIFRDQSAWPDSLNEIAKDFVGLAKVLQGLLGHALVTRWNYLLPPWSNIHQRICSLAFDQVDEKWSLAQGLDGFNAANEPIAVKFSKT